MKSYSSERGSTAYSFLGYAIVVACVIAVIWVIPWGKVEKKERQDANYNAGMGALAKKEYAKAISDFDKSIQSNPNNGIAYLQRAKANLQLGNVDKALDDANIALDKRAGAEAYGLRGVINKINSKTDEALKDFSQAISLDSSYAWAYAQRADIFAKQKKYDLALKDARKAVELKPEFVEGLRLRGWILTRTGKCKEASADFIKVVKLDPQNPNVLQDHAWFLLTCPDEKLQDSTKAMEMAKQAVEMSGGKDSSAQETLAEAYFRQGDALKAIDTQKIAIQLAQESKNCPDGSCLKEMQQRLEKYELAARQEVRTNYEILPLDSSL
jgi:tetratricopeptide (TPR) repeat protein